jgi:hypothetical protein
MDDLAEVISGKRVNFMLRLPSQLAHDIKHMAFERGLSANSMATALLRYGVTATNEQITLKDRLQMMRVK